MGTRWIREASDTPSVSNIDDVRMIRYAYGYQDGILKNVSAQAAASISGSTFKLASGVIVLQGWELEIDANGWSMTVDNVATKRYYAVYYEINLAAGAAEIKSVYSTSGTPSVDVGADLSKQTTGTARLPLYTFSAQNGVISSVVRTAELVEPWTSAGFAKEKDLKEGVIVVKTATNATHASIADSATSADSASKASNATYATYLAHLANGAVATISSGSASFEAEKGVYFYNIFLLENGEMKSFAGIIEIGPYKRAGYSVSTANVPLMLKRNGICYGVFTFSDSGTVKLSLKNYNAGGETAISLNGQIQLSPVTDKWYSI